MFPSLFDSSIFFRRPILERSGYAAQEKDGKIVLKVNVVGLSTEDIRVEVEPAEYPYTSLLIIRGEREDDLFGTFKVNNRFLFRKTPKQIDSELENGFLTLTIEFDEPVKPDVKINWKNKQLEG